MPNNLENMTPGQILAEASVADFISRLGLGIAEAQRALDENSIKQLGEFVQPRPGLGGRTLLDLGLMPAFYHYQSADLSCSLQLSIKVAENIGFDLNLNGSYNNAGSNSSNSSQSTSSTESGSSTRTEARSANIDIQAASAGSLTVGGQPFALTGEDPLARIRALQDALTTSPNSGIGRALYSLTPQPLTITTDADPRHVAVGSNTVAFLSGTFSRGIVQVETDAATRYRLSVTGPVEAVTTPQGSVPSYAQHVATTITAAGYDTVLVGPADPIGTVYFETGRHNITSTGPAVSTRNATIDQDLVRLAQGIRDMNLQVTVEGFTDAQPFRGASASQSTASNVELGQHRAEEVRNRLIANGAPAGNITIVQSRGSTDAIAAGGPIDNVLFRKAVVKTANRTAHWVFVHSRSGGPQLDGVTPDHITTPAPGNGFIFLYQAAPLALAGKKVTIDGTDFALSGAAAGSLAAESPQAYARNLADAINHNATVDFTGSAEANVTTVLRKTQPIRLQLVTAESRNIALTGSQGITVTTEFTRTSNTSQTTQSTGNSTVAVGASLDLRFSRQFEQNVTGNSTISAKLVAIPAPPEFLSLVKTFLTPGAANG